MTRDNERFMQFILSDPNSLLDYAIDWIACNKSPQDVFSDAVLESWAWDNGFVKDEE